MNSLPDLEGQSKSLAPVSQKRLQSQDQAEAPPPALNVCPVYAPHLYGQLLRIKRTKLTVPYSISAPDLDYLFHKETKTGNKKASLYE